MEETQEERGLTVVNGIMVSVESKQRIYDDALAHAGIVADSLSGEMGFQEYHAICTENTLSRQRNDLALFSRYLAEAGITRRPEDLFRDVEAWRGMSYGLLRGMRQWMQEGGYAIGSINVCLATIRQYCKLAKGTGAISEEAFDLIMTVKGYNSKEARNVDQARLKQGKAIRKSTKKDHPTPIKTGQAARLKRTTTTHPDDQQRRPHDRHLPERDALLMCLFIEHGFRCGEVIGLNIEDIDLDEGTVDIYRQKTNDSQRHRLQPQTQVAAEAYLSLEEMKKKTSGPLFLGYKGWRLGRRAAMERVRALGSLAGVNTLSPHDLRHYWTQDALRNGTSIDRVQSAGNWTTPTMVLRYAKRKGIANEDVKISQ
ncbi:MAG: site-specific tyrosine recombinase XerD [Ktedonobacteraceae bacterium]